MSQATLNVVLLAAGYGTRMYPLTKDRPKALLPLGDRVVLDPAIDNLLAVPGLSRIALVTNQRFAGAFRRWRTQRKLDLEVVDDGTSTPEMRLGAVQDMLLGVAQLDASHDVLVLGTDNLFTWSLAELVSAAKRKRPAVTTAIRRAASKAQASRCAVVEMDAQGRLTRFVEKPAQPSSLLVGLCVYYLPASSRPRLEEFIAEGGNGDAPGYFMEWLVAREPVYGFMTSGEWFDIGSSEAYQAALRRWSHPLPGLAGCEPRKRQ